VVAADVQCWLGPCIGPSAFEVGADVVDAFGVAGQGCFRPAPAVAGVPKWWADLPGLAQRRLQAAGVDAGAIGLSGHCTFSEPSRFFSYRRDRLTGRQAALVWLR